MSNKKAQRKKTCVDDLPPDVKPIIIGAIELCGRVSTFIEYVMRDDVSDKQASEEAYSAHVSACKLDYLLHKAFTWEDISKILHDLSSEDGKVEDVVIINKEGESNG